MSLLPHCTAGFIPVPCSDVMVSFVSRFLLIFHSLFAGEVWITFPCFVFGKAEIQRSKAAQHKSRTPSLGFYPLQQEPLHIGSSTEHIREHAPESCEDQYYTPKYTAGKKRVLRSCSSSTILQSWNIVPSCKHFKRRRKLHKSPVSHARPFIRCFKCWCQYTGLHLHPIILLFQQIVFPELACECLHALCSVIFSGTYPLLLSSKAL